MRDTLYIKIILISAIYFYATGYIIIYCVSDINAAKQYFSLPLKRELPTIWKSACLYWKFYFQNRNNLDLASHSNFVPKLWLSTLVPTAIFLWILKKIIRKEPEKLSPDLSTNDDLSKDSKQDNPIQKL